MSWLHLPHRAGGGRAASSPQVPPEAGQPPWHALDVSAVASRLGVDPGRGLTAAEAAERLRRNGPNVLDETPLPPLWKRILAEYKSPMQVMLLVAALISLLIPDFSSFVLLMLLTLANAGLSVRQESRAEASLAGLQQVMRSQARVRRDGRIVEVGAAQIVPGDLVLVEAGDRVPADGRVALAATLQIEESAITGESVPVDKVTDALPGASMALGDRSDMAFMNTNVTRGRGEILVTSTGMRSEVGHIAGMLQVEKVPKTPLVQQVDRLTLFIIGMAVFAFVAILAIGLHQGERLANLYRTGVSLAVGSIPDGLPAVFTMILAMGTVAMARRHAIIKRLPSVETLGSTSAINSDKTGTLTMNEMTVRAIATVGHRYTVTGQGYSSDGAIQRTSGDPERNLDDVLFAAALCNDSEIHDREVIGDPTEGALAVLAAKGGIDVVAFRASHPRIGEVPFDSAYKFMVTFHRMTDGLGRDVVRAYAKGAPDVIVGRATEYRSAKPSPG